MGSSVVSIPGLRPIVYRPETPVPVIASEMLSHVNPNGLETRYGQTLRLYFRRFGEFHAGPIGDLQAEDVRRFLTSLQPCAPRTSNNWLAGLRTLANFAKRRRYLPAWWDELDIIERRPEEPCPVGIYSPKSVAAILAHCARPYRPVVLLVVFAGVRTAEAQRLAWSDVDLPRRQVTVSAGKAKTRARRLCPVSDNLAEWLAPLVGAPATRLYQGGITTFHEGLARAVKRAGVKPIANGLRHSFVSYRMAVLKSAEQVSLEAGNSPAMVFRNYREIVTPEAAREFWSICPEDRQIQLPLAA